MFTAVKWHWNTRSRNAAHRAPLAVRTLCHHPDRPLEEPGISPRESLWLWLMTRWVPLPGAVQWEGGSRRCCAVSAPILLTNHVPERLLTPPQVKITGRQIIRSPFRASKQPPKPETGKAHFHNHSRKWQERRDQYVHKEGCFELG